MEKANVVPTYKKNDKQLVKNCRPISLLPICGKIFEHFIYNKLFHFFQENNLISPNQSGFKPGDSFTNQLLAITHEIYKSFDDGYEVRGVFLDISKSFDKVWHKGLIYKLKQNGISGKLLNLITDFLSNRKQWVVLNGRYSSWTNIEAGVPQGWILGPLFFLIYINDLSDNLITDPNAKVNDLNNGLEKINDWAYQWKMNFNPDPFKQAQEVFFSRKIKSQNHSCLHFNNNPVNQISLQKHLGMYLHPKLDFLEHLKKHSGQREQTNSFITKTPNYSPKNNITNDLQSFY